MAKWKHTKTLRSVLNHQAKWVNEHTKCYAIRLDVEKDRKLIKWLDSKPNKTQTIKEALYLYSEDQAREYSNL